METKTTNIGGKIIKHKEVINYSVTNSFTFKQRIKILFGARAITHAAIFTMSNEIKIIDTAQVTIVASKKQMPGTESAIKPLKPEAKKMQAV